MILENSSPCTPTGVCNIKNTQTPINMSTKTNGKIQYVLLAVARRSGTAAQNKVNNAQKHLLKRVQNKRIRRQKFFEKHDIIDCEVYDETVNLIQNGDGGVQLMRVVMCGCLTS